MYVYLDTDRYLNIKIKFSLFEVGSYFTSV